MDVIRTGYVPVVQETTSIPHHPKDILIELFKRIPKNDLPNCSRVCKEWFNAVNEIWRRSLFTSYRFDVIDDFSPLVANKVLSWRAAEKLSLLPEFCARNFSNDGRGKSIRHGNYTFIIINCDNSSSIEMRINGVETIQTITISESKELQCTRLAVDDNFLYILLKNGVIYQASYRENVEFVREIPTAYAKGDPQLESYWKRKNNYCTEFKVKNGCIVVMWGPFSEGDRNDIWRCPGICEIIRLDNGNRKLIRDVNEPLWIKSNKLFSLVHAASGKRSTKFCYLQIEVDLTTGQETRKLLKVDNYIWKFDVENNMICATISHKDHQRSIIVLIDAVSGKTRKSFNLNLTYSLSFLSNMLMIGNLCIRFFGLREHSIVEVIDLKSKQSCIIRDCYDAEKKTIKAAALTKLVRLCINNPSSKSNTSFLNRILTHGRTRKK